VNHFYLIFVIFFFACFRGKFDAAMFESSTHVIDDSCCSLFCLCFFFFLFSFVLRSGVTHGRLLLQLKLCFCRLDFILFLKICVTSYTSDQSWFSSFKLLWFWGTPFRWVGIWMLTKGSDGFFWRRIAVKC
jgi:hypothetical protein